MSDFNILAPTITLVVGVALGYGFRGLIAREERAELIRLQGYYDFVERIRTIAGQQIQNGQAELQKVESKL